jgi:hypothetical protein
MTAACHHSRRTETYLDGELSPENTVDFEEHLSDCCACQTKLKFEQALRFSLRRTTRVATYPSEGFEAKLRSLMAEARDAEDPHTRTAVPPIAPPDVSKSASIPTPHPRPLSWRAITPLSVAAAAALVFAAMRNEPDGAVSRHVPASVAGNSVASKDTMQTVRDFLDQLAADTEHNPEGSAAMVEESEPVFVSSRPPAIINVSSSRRWPLPKFDSLGAIWEGLHYRNLAPQGRVPSLHYRVGGHRVLLWAYDSERVPLRVLLEVNVARNHPVFVGTHHGLTVAAVEHRGQGFVATTDLSPSEAAEFVVTAAVH